MSMTSHADLFSTAAIQLVAGRELRTRLRSKAYRVTTVALADVEAELSGLELIPRLASRVSACILGVPE